MKTVKDFFRTGKLPRSSNISHILLILKKKEPVIVADLRPISLCNVFYKIIAKMLTIRLRKVIADLIGEEHSAFVPGRHITDNILISFEILYLIKRKTKGNE